MRDFAKVSPRFWTDHNGKQWKVPTLPGRLKFKIPCHAALRAFILHRDEFCQRCGTEDNLVADHILSRKRGGAHHPDNLQALCQSCNSRKANIEDRQREGGD